MAKLTRKDQKVFAENADDNQISVFGSLAAGTKQYTRDPDEIQNTRYGEGWSGAVIRESSPTKQDRNSLDYLFSRQLAYLYQTGIPAYSATDTYYKGSIVSFYSTDDDALKLYYSIVDDNTGNSLEDTDKWVEWKSGGGASLPLLTFQFTDHELNDMSWLKANGSWCSGDVYVAAYRHLTNDLGFRYASSTLTVSHSDYTAGTYVRISSLDTTISSTTYYAWGISGTTDPTKCIFTLTTTLANGVKVFAYKNSTTIYQLTAGIVESQTENVGGTNIVYYRAQDGHKIVLGDQASNALAIYQNAGISWYYIYDSTNTRFKLPRSNWNFKATSDNNTGDFVDQSLPNITGQLQNISDGRNGATASGAFSKTEATGYGEGQGTASQSFGVQTYDFSASASSSVYKTNAHVQEKATRAFLYFYVGTFEQAAIEQTAGLAQENFTAKADVDLGNIDSDGKAVIANYAMPSDTAIGVTIGASGSDHIAPANGYFSVTFRSSGSNQFLSAQLFTNGGTYLMQQVIQSSAASQYMSVFMPASKGQNVKFNFSTGMTDGTSQFVYARGSEPQS